MRPGASWRCESSCRGRGCERALTQLEELGVGVCVTVRSGDGNRGLLHAGTKTQDLTGHTWQGRPVTGLPLGLDSGAQAAAGTQAVPVFTWAPAGLAVGICARRQGGCLQTGDRRASPCSRASGGAG